MDDERARLAKDIFKFLEKRRVPGSTALVRVGEGRVVHERELFQGAGVLTLADMDDEARAACKEFNRRYRELVSK